MQLPGNIKIETERIGRRFMFAFEKKILDYMEKHLDLVIFVMVTIGGFLIRASLRHYISKDAAILFTICVLAGWMISWIVNRIQLSGRNMLYMAFILTFTCVLFLPTMHERYGYIYEILGVLILFFNKKTLPLLLSLNGISLMTYGFYLNDRIINLGTLAVINFAIYVFYGFILTKQIMEDKNKITMES